MILKSNCFKEKLNIYLSRQFQFSCIEEYVTGVLCYWQQWASLSPECSGDVTCYDGARVGGQEPSTARRELTPNTHGVNCPVWTTSSQDCSHEIR